MKQYFLVFGQAYGQGSYGSGTYSCTTQQQNDGTCNVAAGGSSSSGGTGSSLTNTGILAALFVTLACLILFVAFVVRIWKRPKLATQEVSTPEVPQQHDNTPRS